MNETLITKALAITAVAIIVAVLAGLGLNESFQLKAKELRIQAVHNCMTISSYVTNDQAAGVTTTTPMDEQYKKCMTEMGY